MTIDTREPAEVGEGASRGFRKGSPSDANALCEVRELALRATAAGTYTRRQLDAWVRSRGPASFASALDGDDEIFIVAEDDDDPGRLSGFASVIIKGRPHLWSLYVHPSCQGRGIGRGLLGAAEAECRALRLDQLNVAAILTAATFYEAMGYRLVCEFYAGLSSGGGEAKHMTFRHYFKRL
jgi:GNAT superfamily N-acetyltransferase